MAGRVYRIQYQLDGDANGAVRSMKVTDAELKKLKRSQDDAGKGSADLRQRTTDLDKGLANMAQSAARGALALAGIGSVAGAVGVAVRRELQFERTFSQIEGLVGLTRDEVDSLSASVRQLSPEVGIASQQLADAAFFVTSAGFRGAEALDVLTVSAKASAAGLGETVAIADTVTSAVNAYAKQGLQAGAATDILVAAVRAGKLEAATLGPALSKVTSTASALDIGLADVAGTLAVFSRTGTNAEVGATQINAIFNTLLGTSKEGVEALDSVGLSLDKLRRIASEDGLVEVMRTLDQAFGGNLEKLRAVVPSSEALRGVLNALAQDGTTVQGVINDVANATGSLDTAYGVAAQTGSFALQQQQQLLNAEMDKFAGNVMPDVISGATAVVSFFGDSFVPAIRSAAEAVAEAVLNTQGMSGQGVERQLAIVEAQVTRIQRGITDNAAWGLDTTELEAKLKIAESRVENLRAALREEVVGRLGEASAAAQGALAQFQAPGNADNGLPLILREAANAANGVIDPLRAAGDAARTKGRKSKEAADEVNALTDADKNLLRTIAISERQLALMAMGVDSTTAAMQAKIEAASGLDRQLLIVNQRVAEAAAEETQAADAARELQTAITGLREQALTPTERALETFEAQMSTLQDGLAAELIDPAEFAQVAERLKSQYWDKITGDGREAVDEVGTSLTDLQAELDGLSFGNQFAQGFDDASRAAGDFLDGLNGLIEAQSTFNELRAREGVTAGQLAQINRAEQQAQIGLYGDMSQAAKGFFDEGSKGYKALTAAEQVFRAIELAMAAQNLAQKLGFLGAETAAVTAAAGVKATAEGTAAVASAGVGLPFPANLAAIGATVAALASFGVLLGGGGGGGGAAGALDSRGASGLRTSGTILGDPEAASESITNALDRASEIADADLTQSRLMVQSLRNIETALVGVTSEFARIAGERGVQSFALQGTAGASSVDVGGFAPSFEAAISNVFGNSGIIESEQARFDALADRARIGIELGVAEIFDGMSQVVGEAATTFGADRDAAIAAFQAIDISGIEFRESDNVEQAIAEFVSGLGDSAVEQLSAMLGINVDALQRAGEGLFDTLTRVYAEVEVARSGLDRIDSGLGDLDPNRLIAISSALIDAAGGMTEFIDLTKGFVDAFRTEAQQLDIAQREATQAIDQLGFALPGTREEFAALVDSVTVTDAASAQLKVGLLQLVPALDELYGLTEEIASDALDVRRAFGLATSAFDDTLAGLGLAVGDLPNTLGGMQEFIDGLTEADQAALRPFIGDLDSLITVADEASEALGNVTRDLSGLTRSLEDEIALLQAADPEMERINQRIRDLTEQAGDDAGVLALIATLESLQIGSLEAARAAETAAAAQRDLEAAQQAMAQAISDAQSRVSSAEQALAQAQQGVRDAQVAVLNEQIEGERARFAVIQQGIRDQLAAETAAINARIAGARDVASASQAVAGLLSGAASSVAGLSLTRAQALSNLQARAGQGGRLAVTPAFERSVSAAQDFSADEFASQIEMATAQSLTAETLAQLAGRAEKQLTSDERSVELLEQSLTEAQARADQQLAVAEAYHLVDVELIEEQIKQINGTLTAVQALDAANQAAAIAQYDLDFARNELARISNSAANQQLARLAQIDESTRALYLLARDSASTSVPGFATGGMHSGGLRVVGENGPELEATGPSRIWNQQQIGAAMGGGGDPALRAEVAALRREVATLNNSMRQTASNTARSANSLDRFETQGVVTVSADA